MQAAQYWKPGEKKPRDGDVGPEKPSKRREGGSSRESGGSTTAGGKKKGDRRGDRGAEQQHSSSGDGNKRGGSAKKRGKKSKGKDAESSGGIDAEVSRSAAKPPVAGPSQGLLAMKVCGAVRWPAGLVALGDFLIMAA